jgi:hypothetical protein
VDDGVDKVCRHADHVVRSLGTELWKRLSEGQVRRSEQGQRDPPAVWKKNFAAEFLVRYPQILSTGVSPGPVDNRAYGSTLAGTADLIIFDGVFDRRVRHPARG